MGDAPDARLALSKLIKDYPASTEAAQARQKLAELEPRELQSARALGYTRPQSMRVIRHLAHVAAAAPRASCSRSATSTASTSGTRRSCGARVGEARAVGGQVVVLTFHPHPVAVLAPDTAPPLLQSLHDRLALLRDLGVDVDGRAALHADASPPSIPRRSCATSCGAHLELLHVVVGYNVSFGRGARGHGGHAARARRAPTASRSTPSVP